MPKHTKRPSSDAVDLIAQYVNLSPEALQIAEGWTVLPSELQRHVKLVIDGYIATQNPTLKKLYDSARPRDQVRASHRIEQVQDRLRGIPAEET